MKTVDAIAWYFSLTLLVITAAWGSFVFLSDASVIAKVACALLITNAITNAATCYKSHKENQ
jgi:hypothetical protein